MLFTLNETESMFFYFFIFIFASLFAFLADEYGKTNENGTKNFNKIFWSASLLIAWLPLAFRYYVGTDYENYKLIYQYISDGTMDITDIEPGYWLINIIGDIFYFDYQYVIAVTSLITLCLFYTGLSYYCKKVNVGIAVFILLALYYPVVCNLARFSIAMGFAFISYMYIANRQFSKFILIIMTGALFHYSVISVIPCYFIAGKTGLKLWVKGAAISGTLLILLNIEYLFPIFASSTPVFEKYQFYEAQGVTFGLGIVLYMAIYLALYFFLDRNVNSNAVAMDILLYGFVFGYIGSAVTWSSRLAYYFNMTYILLIPQIGSLIKPRWRVLYFPLVIIFLSALFYYNSVIIGLHEIIPYSATYRLF